jgi:SAM-dependent methyltransferase
MSDCRFCRAPLSRVFCDLGLSPLSNNYLEPKSAGKEARYPLCAYVCDRCLLVQLEAFETPEQIFSDYAYFSSYSDSWLEHCRTYAYAMRERLALGPKSLVVEVASNDGYLLQYFREQAVPVLGIEPAANVAAEAEKRGVPTLVRFFGTQLADELRGKGRRADLLVGNNVLAHVPDLNDFVAGLARLLADEGVVTMEFPHLLRLMRETQFDTIYHEHFSYFSLLVADKVFRAHGMLVFDVDQIPTHGGSLRIHACLAASKRATPGERVKKVLADERAAGLDRVEGYSAFAGQVLETKHALLAFLAQAKKQKKKVVGYGAPAKGNTLLNYCGLGARDLEYTVDRSPHKQGKLLPGSHIPVFAPEHIRDTRPDYVLILPWNIKDEVISQMGDIREWGGRFVVPIPRAEVVA